MFNYALYFLFLGQLGKSKKLLTVTTWQITVNIFSSIK